jgi:hypothetical protein
MRPKKPCTHLARVQSSGGRDAEVIEAAMRCGQQCVSCCPLVLHGAGVLPALFAAAADGCRCLWHGAVGLSYTIPI